MLAHSCVRLLISTLMKLCFRFLLQMSAYYVKRWVDENNNRSNRFQGDEGKGEPLNEVASWIHLRSV